MSSQFWDERFSAEEYVYGREPNEFLRAEADRIPPGPVLCLAEGEGRNAVFLAERGHTVTAVDFSLEALRKTARLAQECGVPVTTIHADLALYEPKMRAYAGIIAIFAHLPPAVRARVHTWVPSALQPGGVFLLEAYTPDQLALGNGGPREPEWLMTRVGLQEELAPLHFEIAREVRREIQEGKFHTGLSATVQVVAVRGAE